VGKNIIVRLVPKNRKLRLRVERIAALIEDEPEYLGTNIPLLTTLRRLGTWSRERPLPKLGIQGRIPHFVVQFWDQSTIPDDIAAIMTTVGTP
jgi:hypothetical protein